MKDFSTAAAIAAINATSVARITTQRAATVLPIFRNSAPVPDRPEKPGLRASGGETGIKLRDYQNRIVRELYDRIRSGSKRPLIVALMGSGKTVIASWIMRDAVLKGRRAAFAVPLNQLLDQAAQTLERLGVRCTVLQGKRKTDPTADALVFSLQTFESKLKRASAREILGDNLGVLFMDEAHVSAFRRGFDAIAEAYPDLPIVGLTATPWRLSKKEHLGQKFDPKSVIVGPQPTQLIKSRKAVPCRPYGLGGALDLETLTVRNGEFEADSIANQALRPEALAAVLREWQRLASDRPTIAVGATIEQARRTAEFFNAAGIPSETIVGDTRQEDRDAIVARLRSGQTRVVTSVGCLTAGFDCPPVSCLLLVRATKSRALFLQIAGRAARPFPGKDFFVLLDFGGNVHRHGDPMSDQDYTITKPQPEDSPVPLKDCPQCGVSIPVFARLCPHCGYEFGGDDGDPDPPEIRELVEFFDKTKKRQLREIRAARRAAFVNDQNPVQPLYDFRDRWGMWPPKEWMRYACLGRKNSSMARRVAYLDWVQRHCTRREHLDDWTAYNCDLEFGTDFDGLLATPLYWEALGVEPGAGPEQVKQAYREAAALASAGEFEVLNAAYDSAQADFEFAASEEGEHNA